MSVGCRYKLIHDHSHATYLRLSQQTKQLTTFHKVHNHVQVLRIRVCTPQRDQEWMLDFRQHSPFIIGMLNLLHLDNLLFLQHLDSIESLVMLRLSHVNTAETTCTECSFELEVVEGVFALGGLGVALDRPGSICHGPYTCSFVVHGRCALCKGYWSICCWLTTLLHAV